MSKTTSSGFSLGWVLFIVFMVLKLTKNIDWSWWWVTSPLWLPLVVLIVFAGIFVFIKTVIFGK
jgi:hypothetical protein